MYSLGPSLRLQAIVLLAGLVAWTSSASAQIIRQPAGVYVDAQGALRYRAVDNKLKRPAGKLPKETLCQVSLPKLFDELKTRVEANEPIPEKLRLLDGLVKIDYVFLDASNRDLIIAGKSEPISDPESLRPRGAITGRPVIRLDDLVVALRTLGPGGQQGSFGCSIDLSNEAVQRMVAVAQQAGALARGNYDPVGNAMIQACGPQPIRFFGVRPDCQFALVCVEADYLMKRLSLGLEKSPVKGLQSHLALMKRGEPMYSRFWFSANYQPMLVNEAGDAYGIRGQALRVRTSASEKDDDGTGTPSAKMFAEQMTAKFPEMATKIPEFADLWNVADLAYVACLIRTDGLAQKVNWDMTWALDAKGYKPAQWAVPTIAETLGNYKAMSNSVIFCIGGVNLDIGPFLQHREKDLDKLVVRPKEPIDPERWSLTTEIADSKK